MFRLSDKALQNVYYALPRIAGVSLFAPINIVQGIYAKHYGIALTTIASVILFARLFDAVTDPIIGYLSDREFHKRGTRKPFMIIGALVMISSGYFLYSPPNNVTAIYFALWFMAFYLGFTLFEIPHLAWGGEISLEGHEKTQTYNTRAAGGFSGLVLFYSIPLLPFWEAHDITPQILEFSAIVSGLLMLPCLYLCIKRVPNGYSYVKKLPSHKTQIEVAKTPTNTGMLRCVIRNQPLLLFLAAFIFAGIGLGMWYGLIFIFVDSYIAKGHWFAEIYLMSFAVGALASLVWIRVSKRIGKKQAWIVAMFLGVASFVYTYFITPNNVNYLTLVILLMVNTLCLACIESLPQSMLSDIVDYSTLIIWELPRIYIFLTIYICL